ncbi:uncharacterized protein LOC143366511 [Andrena cerasifolii]|uniref:uncharacterized protein LOC143366511 n=1 Tax=Andrena cerasifolii TaxID=2819439 RepID=UPI004037F5DB
MNCLQESASVIGKVRQTRKRRQRSNSWWRLGSRFGPTISASFNDCPDVVTCDPLNTTRSLVVVLLSFRTP